MWRAVSMLFLYGGRPLEQLAASGRGRLRGLGVEGPRPDVAVTSAADAALLGDDQVTLSTRVLIPPVSLPDAAHASLGATSDGARPPGHPSNILLYLPIRQLTKRRPDRKHLISRNPADLADPPKPSRAQEPGRVERG
jgi:hypothetical protein